MKLYRKRDLKRCGIYAIKNLINNKVYIGKSINIYERIRQHINLLNKKDLNENRHLINSWHKYGRDNFQYFVLEDVILDNSFLKDRELFWMVELNSLSRTKGYNLRQDSSTNCIVSQETKSLQSINRKKRFLDNPELVKANGERTSLFWKNNPEIKNIMSRKVSDKLTLFKILQYDKKTKELIKTWMKVKDIILENPTYKVHNIYAVCSGEKPSMYGYIWEKQLIEK